MSTFPFPTGYFGIKVKDPGYSLQALFHYDVGVKCPPQFNIKFRIPTSGPDDYDKKMLVEINDSFRTIKMTVFRPAPNETKEANCKYSNIKYLCVCVEILS